MKEGAGKRLEARERPGMVPAPKYQNENLLFKGHQRNIFLQELGKISLLLNSVLWSHPPKLKKKHLTVSAVYFFKYPAPNKIMARAICSTQSKIIRHLKKQENTAQNEKIQSIDTDPKKTETIELARTIQSS